MKTRLQAASAVFRMISDDLCEVQFAFEKKIRGGI
jgi:hypothetical protein